MQITDENLRGVERCPYCSVANPLLKRVWGPQTLTIHGSINNGVMRNWACYECSTCHLVVLARGRQFGFSNGNFSGSQAEAFEIDAMLPTPHAVDIALPPAAQRYLKQAFDTIHAPDACVVMAAAAVDSMLKEKGFATGSLYNRIDAAVTAHILTAAMGQWAHAVRLEANAVRHADQERPHMDTEDAQKVLDFAKALGDFLYVFTARVDAGLAQATGPV